MMVLLAIVAIMAVSRSYANSGHQASDAELARRLR